MRSPLLLLPIALAFSMVALACEKPAPAPATAPSTAAAPSPSGAAASAAPSAAAPADGSSLHAFTMNRLDGKPESLATYKGKVVLVVNTASECGFTPQYEGLEKLYEELSPREFVVLGFPSNDFGEQEPGTSQEIAKFCTTKFKVTFPLFEKVVTKGPGAAPLYAYLARGFGAPEWNFHKYLVGKDGQVRKAFPSKVTPDSAELRKAIEELLLVAGDGLCTDVFAPGVDDHCTGCAFAALAHRHPSS